MKELEVFARYCLTELKKKERSTVFSMKPQRIKVYLLLSALQVYAGKPTTHELLMLALVCWSLEDEAFKSSVLNVIKGDLNINA